MSKKLLSITIDEELIEQLKSKAKKGELSKFTEEVIQIGLNTSADNDLTLVQHLKRALALAENLNAPIPIKKEEHKEQQGTDEVQEIFKIFKEQHELDINEGITDEEILTTIKDNIDDLNSVKVSKAELEECENNEEIKLVTIGKKAEYLYNNYYHI